MKPKKLNQIKKYALNSILSLMALFSFVQLSAQSSAPTMDLKIEFDDVADNYGVYFRSDVDINAASMIISQISLTIPSMLISGILITGQAIGWNNSSNCECLRSNI